MHFLLLGASGRTGRLVVSEVLSQGHTATALVRDPNSLEARDGLTIITGTPLSKQDITKAISASPMVPSAAIFTLNANRTSDNPFSAPAVPPRFLADCCANLCEAMKQAGSSRVVVMSTLGAGNSWANLSLVAKAFMGLTNIKYALEDHNILDQEIRSTEMDWTLVRAARLDYKEQKTPSEVEVLDGTGKGQRMSDGVNVASVARFLVKVAMEGLCSRSAVVVRQGA